MAFYFLAMAVVILPFLHPVLWYFTGFHFPFPLYPFLDTYGTLASFEAYALGWDVTNSPNPLDILFRINAAGTWGLFPGYFGVDRSIAFELAIFMIIGYLALSFIILNPRSVGDGVIGFFVICSPGAMLCIERGNVDMAVFILAILLSIIYKGNGLINVVFGSLICYYLFLLKYYPAVLVLTSLLNSGYRKYLPFVIVLFGSLVYIIIKNEEVYNIMKIIPSPDTFLANGFPMVFNKIDILFGVDYFNDKVISLVMALIIIITIFIFVSVKKVRTPSSNYWDVGFYITGSVLTSFCYFTNSSYDYRLIYIVPMLPLLFHLKSLQDTHFRVIAYAMIFSLLLGLWLEHSYLFYGMFFTEDFNKNMSYRTVQLLSLTKNLLLLVFNIFSLYILSGIIVTVIKNDIVELMKLLSKRLCRNHIKA